MSERTTTIVIEARDEFTPVLRKISASGGKMGADVKGAFAAVDAETKKATTSTTALFSAMQKVGSTRGFDQAAASATGYWKAVDMAREKTDGLNRSAESVRNFGLALGAAGVGATMLSNSLAKSFQEGAAATAKLDAMLAKRGEGGRMQEMSDWASKLAYDAAQIDDDPIKDAAAGLMGFGVSAKMVKDLMPGLIGQSRLYNQSLEGVSEAAGRAFGKGDMSGLSRIGITLTEEQIQKTEQLKKSGASMAERQAALYGMLKESFAQYALGMTEGMSATEVAANRQALAMDAAQEAVGKGAAKAKESLDNMTGSVLNMVGANPKLAEGAGLILGYGGYAAAAAGGLATFAGGLGQAYLAVQAFKGARNAEAIATGAATLATNANTVATVASGNAALAASWKFKALGAAKLLGAGALGVGLGVGIYEATRGEDDPGAGEAAGNAWATTKRAFGIDAELTEEDGLTRSQKLDNQLAAFHQKRQESQLAKQMAAITQAASATNAPGMAAAVTAAPIMPSVDKALKSSGMLAIGAATGKQGKDSQWGAWLKGLKSELDAPPSEVGGRGEENIQRYLPWAQRLFDNMTQGTARRVFNAMAQKFEQPGGFEGEAQMAAAKRVFWQKFMNDALKPPSELALNAGTVDNQSASRAMQAASESVASQLRGALVAPSWGGPDTGGSMLRLAAGNYGNEAGSMIGTDRARMAAGMAAANRFVGADRFTYPSGEAPGGRAQLNSRLKSNRGGKQVFEVFGEIEVGEFEDSSGQRLARSSAVMGW